MSGWKRSENQNTVHMELSTGKADAQEIELSQVCDRRVMRWLLVLSLYWTAISGAPQQPSYTAGLQGDPIRPNIYYCRSPNMEIFTCWWHPLDNGSHDDDNITYTLIYTTGEQPPKECPDYVTGGPNSCYFDTQHTQIWEMYCMNVTAHTRLGPLTSQRHCVDVADIVVTDPPFNLTYTFLNGTGDESGRTVLISWMYPIPTQVREGWITLTYELRYRHLSEPDNWKVKERLREPHLELLDLPVGSYEVMVRCRSRNSKHWSKWSEPLNVTISTRPLPDRMLAFMLVTGIGIMAFLIIGFGVIPRGKRIKAFLLPPIPKPRIRGIDPLLLKKGKIEEINHHFSSFHGYKPPQYCMETWYQVNVDMGPPMTPNSLLPYHKENTANGMPFIPHLTYPDVQQSLQTNHSPSSYCLGPALSTEHPSPYCDGSLQVATTPQTTAGAWPVSGPTQPELVSFPGLDYSMILNSTPPSTTVIQPTSQDFYTCVNGVTPSGAVHLVPCLPESLKSTPYLQFKEGLDGGSEKSSQLAALLEKQMEALTMECPDSVGETEQGEFAVPLLPHSADRN